MCKVLKISRSGYYYWLKHPEGRTKKRNKELLLQIKIIYKNSKGTYGSPRITKELQMSGVKVSQKTVANLMRKNNNQKQREKEV